MNDLIISIFFLLKINKYLLHSETFKIIPNVLPNVQILLLWKLSWIKSYYFSELSKVWNQEYFASFSQEKRLEFQTIFQELFGFYPNNFWNIIR